MRKIAVIFIISFFSFFINSMDIKERRFQVFVKTIEHENCVKKIIQLMGGEIVEPECKDKKFFVIKIIHANANIFQQKLKTNNIEFEEAA